MRKYFETVRLVFQDTRVKQLFIFCCFSIVLIVVLLVYANYSLSRIGIGFCDFLFGNKYSAGLWTLISAGLFSPVAFILWYFRDQNQQLQIENHRKDINLKDFQKLCEWASGLHLVEEKVTVNQKTNAQGIEKTETIEQSRPPVNSSADTTSRRDGSIGLQIAAIYQLRAFIEGTHGEHFIRPALLLLLTLWEGLMDKHQQAYYALKEKEKVNPVSEDEKGTWRRNMRNSSACLFGQALSEVIFHNNGKSLEKEKRILVNKKLIGLSPYLQHSIKLNWNDVDLEMSNIFCCTISNANLTKCNFSHAKLKECYFVESQLVDCDFDSAILENCNLGFENPENKNSFINCVLNLSRMENSSFRFVCFTDCLIDIFGFINNRFINCTFMNNKIKFNCGIDSLTFTGSKFSNLDFEVTCRSANFHGCVFIGVNFKNANIINGLFNADTKFQDCTASLNTGIKVCTHWEENGYFGILPIETHALRLRLRDTNGLILNPQAYTEYADKWNELSEVQQNDYYRNAYKNANRDNVI